MDRAARATRRIWQEVIERLLHRHCLVCSRCRQAEHLDGHLSHGCPWPGRWLELSIAWYVGGPVEGSSHA